MTNGMPAPKESVIVGKIIKWLNGLDGCYCIKQHGNAFSVQGTPDIIGCYKGRMFAFEVKRPGNNPTAAQWHQMALWSTAGARVDWLVSLDEAKAVMREAFGLD